MADSDNATRAPESDLQDQEISAEEKSGIPGDTVPDQGASMGVRDATQANKTSTDGHQEHCTTDRPTRTSLAALSNLS